MFWSLPWVRHDYVCIEHSVIYPSGGRTVLFLQTGPQTPTAPVCWAYRSDRHGAQWGHELPMLPTRFTLLSGDFSLTTLIIIIFYWNHEFLPISCKIKARYLPSVSQIHLTPPFLSSLISYCSPLASDTPAKPNSWAWTLFLPFPVFTSSLLSFCLPPPAPHLPAASSSHHWCLCKAPSSWTALIFVLESLWTLSYHLPPYNTTRVPLTIFLMLCLSSLWRIYSIPGGLCEELVFLTFWP